MRAALARLSVLCLVALTACSEQAALPEVEPGPVLVVAIDALDLRTVRELADRGTLPELRELMREGGVSALESERPASPVVVWGEVATGASWRMNGIYQEHVTGRFGAELWADDLRVLPAVWEGREGGAFNWFRRQEPQEPGGTLPWPLSHAPESVEDLILDVLADNAAVAAACESNRPMRLVRLRSAGAVALQHWGPEHLSIIADVYLNIDRLIGRLRDCMEEGESLLLVSSSAVRPQRTPGNLTLDPELLLQRLGYLQFRDGSDPTQRSGRVVDTEQSRVLVLSPLRRWPDYAQPVFLAINETAVPPERRARFTRLVASVLSQLRTRGQGIPFFRNVEVWHGRSTPAAKAPSLVIYPNPEAVSDRFLVRGTLQIDIQGELVFRYQGPRGAAVPPGWVLPVGPAFRRREAGSLRPVDLAALLLYLRAEPLPEYLEGAVPPGLLATRKD